MYGVPSLLYAIFHLYNKRRSQANAYCEAEAHIARSTGKLIVPIQDKGGVCGCSFCVHRPY